MTYRVMMKEGDYQCEYDADDYEEEELASFDNEKDAYAFQKKFWDEFDWSTNNFTRTWVEYDNN